MRHPPYRRCRLAPLAAALGLAAAGAPALAVNVYTGGAHLTPNPSADAKWSTVANWDVQPAAGGGNTVELLFCACTPNNRYSTAQDHGNPFVLKSLSFDSLARAYTIAGNALRFDADVGRARIENNTDATAGADLQHTVSSNLQLAQDLVLAGLANDQGSRRAQVHLSGTIADAAAGTPRAVRVEADGSGSFLLSGNNSFAGGVTLIRGKLVVGSNTALGTGSFRIAGGAVRAGTDQSRTLANAVTIDGDFQVGEFAVNRSLTFSGASTVNGMRTISAPNPTAGANSEPSLIFGGAVAAADSAGIKWSGAAAGDYGLAAGRANSGGVLRFDAASAGFRGTLEVASGTVFVTQPLGAAATPVKAVTVANNARLGGSARISLPAGGKISLAPAIRNTPNRGGILIPGSSAGIFEVAGGDVEFGAGAIYGFEFFGQTPGIGIGFHDLLRLDGGTVTLLPDGSDRPILDVEVLSDVPVVGREYTVIDIANPAIGRIGGEFMTLGGQLLTEGADFVDRGGFAWRISYVGGVDDNDVVLTAVPEPAAALLLMLGLLGVGLRVVRSPRAVVS